MNTMPTPSAPPVAFPVRLGESLDDAARAVLVRLDPRRATAEQVRNALAAAGIHVPLVLAAAWLDGRRAA